MTVYSATFEMLWYQHTQVQPSTGRFSNMFFSQVHLGENFVVYKNLLLDFFFIIFFFLLFLLFCLVFLSLFLYHPKYFIFPFVSIFEHAFSYIATQIPMYSKYFSVPEECRNIKKNKEWSFSTASDIFLVHCWCGLQKSSRIFQTWKLSTLSSL